MRGAKFEPPIGRRAECGGQARLPSPAFSLSPPPSISKSGWLVLWCPLVAIICSHCVDSYGLCEKACISGSSRNMERGARQIKH
jgi:hypothetical protein